MTLYARFAALLFLAAFAYMTVATALAMADIAYLPGITR